MAYALIFLAWGFLGALYLTLAWPLFNFEKKYNYNVLKLLLLSIIYLIIENLLPSAFVSDNPCDDWRGYFLLFTLTTLPNFTAVFVIALYCLAKKRAPKFVIKLSKFRTIFRFLTLFLFNEIFLILFALHIITVLLHECSKLSLYLGYLFRF